MEEEKDVTDYLTDRTRKMIENNLLETESPEMKKLNAHDEKAEQQAFSKTGENWDKKEIRYLLNNRTEMDNEEMEEFLKGQKDFQKNDSTRFTNSEERFLLQNYSTMDLEEIAERIDKSPRAVEMQLRIMGLGGEI